VAARAGAAGRGGGVTPARRVVLTGAESTGKTTLAAELARAHRTMASPEYARLYLEARGGVLGEGDVEPIARGQLEAEDQAEAAAGERIVVFKDTDLLSTLVYARHYYGGCPAWIEAAARARRADLYLLLHPDVPWVADQARDRPQAREHIHAVFRQALQEIGAAHVDVRGSWDQRRATALDAVARLLAGRQPGPERSLPGGGE
jgi:NadR type nicotinamide-nucleotide adenylyltransferase